jgi:hypothetical protein
MDEVGIDSEFAEVLAMSDGAALAHFAQLMRLEADRLGISLLHGHQETPFVEQ